MIYLLLLFLASCASAPATYADGAPLRPAAPPTYTPPGTGLPEYFAPPARQRSPEPVPDRVLPEDERTRRGPGLWAARPPDASPYPPVHLLGVVFETPEPPTEFEWDTVARCALSIQRVGGDELVMLARRPVWPRACALARLYLHCAEGVASEGERRKAAGVEYDATAVAAFKRIIAAAAKEVRDSCRRPPTEEEAQWIRAIALRWAENQNNQ